MFDKQPGRAKSLLVFEVLGNYVLAGFQCVACRRSQVRPNGGLPNHAFTPTDPRSNQKPVLGRNILHHFAIFRFQPFRRHPSCVIDHFNKTGALQSEDTQLGEKLLLPDAQAESATGHVVCLIGSPFNDWLFGLRWWAHGR